MSFKPTDFLLRSGGLVLASCLLAGALDAQIVSYTITGQTTTNWVEAGALTTEYPVGTPWSAVLAWDTSASPLYLDATQSQYRMTEFTVTFQGLNGTWSTSALANTASFTENYLSGGAQDLTQFTSSWGPASHTTQTIEEWSVYSLNVILSDPTGNAIPSLTPAPTGISFTDWSPLVANSQLKIYLNNSANRYILGNIQSISVTGSAIPEPSTYAALAGLTAFGLVVWRRRKRLSAR